MILGYYINKSIHYIRLNLCINTDYSTNCIYAIYLFNRRFDFVFKFDEVHFKVFKTIFGQKP